MMVRITGPALATLMLAAACGGAAGSGDAVGTTTVPATTSTAVVATTTPTETTAAPATTAGTLPPTDDPLELGRFIWEEYFLGDGCQECHGPDARGTADVPDIRGASRTKIVDALADVEEMDWGTELTSKEIDAVWAYLTKISESG